MYIFFSINYVNYAHCAISSQLFSFGNPFQAHYIFSHTRLAPWRLYHFLCHSFTLIKRFYTCELSTAWHIWSDALTPVWCLASLPVPSVECWPLQLTNKQLSAWWRFVYIKWRVESQFFHVNAWNCPQTCRNIIEYGWLRKFLPICILTVG